jgi:acyl carrier protein
MAELIAPRIKDYIVTEIMLGDEHASLDDATPLLDGVLDSLSLMQLVSFIEDEFGAELDDADITSDNFRTIADIEHLVRQRAAT